MKKPKIFSILVTIVFFFLILRPDLIRAQGEALSDQPPAQAPALTLEQLEILVAPIALYPDPLLSQVLVASTYPLELVQAYQWLQQHPELQGQARKDAAAQQSWDPSVQALVLFPDVIKRLNADVTWTTNLGNAFLADQGNVMDAIQRLRVKAEQAGKLQSSAQEKVTTTTESGQPVVEIQPADPEVIYVPVYNPVWIWGPPSYDYYPAWYYPSPPPFGVWFLWGPAFQMNFYYPGWMGYGGWGGWGWRPGWRDHAVIVNRTFFVHNHYHAVPVGNTHNAPVWVHNPDHRRGVAYPNRKLVQRFNPPRTVRPTVAHPTVNQVQKQINQRTVTGSAPQHLGNHTIESNSFDRNRSAFGGTDKSSATRVYSDRGHASLARPAGAVKSPNNRGGGKAEEKGGEKKFEKTGGRGAR